ncbi:MAG TPA: nuclear transport factor 2 family protein [Nitrososphaeraceae archaeon]
MSEKKGVEQTIVDSNNRFYTAFESLSIENMDEVWKHSDDTVCIHPGWEMFTSWTAIRESWITIFENTRIIKFFISNMKVKAFQDIAIVVCLENIDSFIGDENNVRMGVVATNIFEKQHLNRNKQNNEWLLIHHHGSAIGNYIVPNVSI